MKRPPLRQPLRTPHFGLKSFPRPHGLRRTELPPELTDKLSEEALEIFTEVCNVGYPFAKALLAVYLSGLVTGVELQKERGNG